jgi:hemerythrin-like domain-containing protein
MANDIIQRLQEEHLQTAVLLDKFEQVIESFCEGESINFDALRLLMTYFGHFPDEVHHRKEDLIYDLLNRSETESYNGADLQEEHANLVNLSSRLSLFVEFIDLDQEIPRSEVFDVAKEFLTCTREHIAHEEHYFFPAARNALSENELQKLSLAAEEIAPRKWVKVYEKLYRDIIDALAA